MSAADDLVGANREFAERFEWGGLAARPARGLAVVACMDARIDVYRVLALAPGDAHVIRNAGGVVTDDVIRSLMISQRLLGTTEIVLVRHTECGVVGLREDDFVREVERETGRRPPFPLGATTDLDGDLRASIATLRNHPFLTRTSSVRGFVYDVRTGLLREVRAA